jgi:UDP-glucose 4-epimerase
MRDASEDPLWENRETNTQGTRRLAEACARAGVRRLVFLSTIKVNGEATPMDRGFTEEDPPAPSDPYAVSKWEAEQALWEIAADKSMAGVVIRPPLVYGPGVKGNFLRLLSWVRRGVPLPLASVKNLRSYVGLTNLVDLIITCLNHPSAAGQTFLAGDGRSLSTPDLIRRLAAALDKSPRLWPFPPKILQRLGALMGIGDAVERLCGSLVVETGKASKTLGWVPPRSVDDELRDTARWFVATAEK